MTSIPTSEKSQLKTVVQMKTNDFTVFFWGFLPRISRVLLRISRDLSDQSVSLLISGFNYSILYRASTHQLIKPPKMIKLIASFTLLFLISVSMIDGK